MTEPLPTFEDLGLSPETLKAIDEKGYKNPTPIQAKAIPHILMMRDLIGLAQTGTGKTASFTLPMIDILANGRARSRMPRSLVLAPTRELAAQVAENFDEYGKYHPLSKALLVGGESMNEQIKKLEKGVDVLIATPGRLLDLFERGQILLSDIKVLVIDEADRMLDMGFIPDIEKIVSKLPFNRQTLLFSATMAKEIEGLAKKFLTNPREVSVAPPASPAKTVTQNLVWTTSRGKEAVLCELLDRENVKNAFIFCNRKKEVDMLARSLKKKGYNAAPMHGDLAQKLRNETLDGFKSGEVTLLICSDVAARGLDVDAVSHVFNYDVPYHPDDYVHRIGRTGRAGKSGAAWMLATEDDQKYIAAIEANTGIKVPVVKLESVTSSSSSASSSSSSSSSEKTASAPKKSKVSDINDARNKRGDKKPKAPRPRDEADDSDTPQGFGEDIPSFFR
ncbi:MAG: DEAD/DEAH box helicase [Pseudobdellovibrionaceae bacterium]